MDHLAVFDGFGSTSFDLAGLPATELDRSATYRRDRDKGKARACEDSDDAFDAFGLALAESSRSGRNVSTLSDNSSRWCDTRSADHSDTKGKARQQIDDTHPSHTRDTLSYHATDLENAATSVTESHFLRTSLTSTPSQSRYCERSASVSCSYHDDTSLKRSIREMGSSPSSSPRQHTHSLPVAQACSSTSLRRLDIDAGDASTSSSSSTGSGAAHSRPDMANKKRRSFRPDELQNDTFAMCTGQPSTRALADTPLVNAPLRSERHDRRASLLVNSSTRDTQSFDSTSALCASPEPLDALPRSEPSSTDLSQRRSAFLASARAQRSNSTIRRRRGFYLRDADLLRNNPSEESLASVDRANTTASETFMADFSRAVDLRLAARSSSPHPGAFSSTSLGVPQLDHRHASRDAAAQPSAPQLPYPRSASPLSIPFAADEADQASQHAQRGLTARNTRRRIPVPVHEDFALVNQDEASAATSRRSLYRPAFWESTSTQLRERSSLASSTDNQISYRHPTAHSEARAWRSIPRHGDSAATASATAATATSDQRPTAQRPHHIERGALHRPESRTRDEAAADDFGAVQRPFGLRGSRLARRAFRSRAEDDAESGLIATAGSDQAHISPLRRDADHSNDRSAAEAQEQRNSLPWGRSHFGLRTPSRHPEPQLSPAQSRFEPFAEDSSLEPRRSVGLAGSRGSAPHSVYRERHENESALEYLGRLMSHDSMLDEWMAGDVHGPLLRMAIESEVLQSYPHLRHLGHAPASTSSVSGQAPHLAFDARNFIADEDWAELNSYEGLMQLSERLGAADLCVPQSLIDTLPTCEYGKWDGGSCKQRGDASSASPPLVGKGKGKQRVEPPATTRDTMCPICREDYLDSDMLMSINKCCHAFHADCIKTWFKTAKTCPLCRADAFDEISLPALSFESSSSASRATPTGNPTHPTWSFNF